MTSSLAVYHSNIHQTVNRSSRFILYAIFFCVVLFNLNQRDLTAINELKYFSISLDSLKSGDWFSFYYQGEIYADKPPLYFWLMLTSLSFVDINATKLIMGLFSILPAIGICEIMYRWSKHELSHTHQMLATAMTLTSVLFLGTSAIIRMDMLMVFFMTLALYNLYLIFNQVNLRKKHGYYFVFSTLLALLTKGPVGFAIPMLMALLYYLYRRKSQANPVEVNHIFPLGAVLISLEICALWFAMVYRESGADYLYQLTIQQFLDRGIQGNVHPEPIYFYLWSLVKSSMPWSLFIAVSLCLGIKHKLIRSSFSQFLASACVLTLVLLSLASSKLDIYLLPVIPWLIWLSIYIFAQLKSSPWFSYALYPISGLFMIASGILWSRPANLIPEFIQQGDLQVSAISLFVISSLSLLLLLKKRVELGVFGLSFAMMSLIFTLSIPLPKYNAWIGIKTVAQKIKDLPEYKQGKVYSYQFKSGQNLDVYLGKKVAQIDSSEAVSQLPRGSMIVIKHKQEKLITMLSQVNQQNNQPSLRYYEMGKYGLIVR